MKNLFFKVAALAFVTALAFSALPASARPHEEEEQIEGELGMNCYTHSYGWFGSDNGYTQHPCP